MPKPPPMFRILTGAGAARASSIASATAFCCASTIASARRFCEPLKMWNPTNVSGSLPICSSTAGTRSASMPNCFGPPLIFMPEVLSSKSGFTRTATCGRSAGPACDLGQSLDLELRLDVENDARRDCSLELCRRLAGAGEADQLRPHAGIERHSHFARRGDVEPVDERSHVAHDVGHRIRLDRVVQMHTCRQRGAQCGHALAQVRRASRRRTACDPLVRRCRATIARRP